MVSRGRGESLLERIACSAPVKLMAMFTLRLLSGNGAIHRTRYIIIEGHTEDSCGHYSLAVNWIMFVSWLHRDPVG